MDIVNCVYTLGKQKKSLFFSRPTSKDGGVRAWPGLATRKKEIFLKLKKNPKKMWPLSSRGEGALVAGQLKKNLFVAALTRPCYVHC